MPRTLKYGGSIRALGVLAKTYECWRSMRKRCSYPKDKCFHLYGGRGITVCKRWQDFSNFLKDMGKKPPGMTLERINNDGNYSPCNCKWATLTEQASNRRSSRFLDYRGKRMTVIQWQRELRIFGDRTTLYKRLSYGWSIKKALETPRRKYYRVVAPQEMPNA